MNKRVSDLKPNFTKIDELVEECKGIFTEERQKGYEFVKEKATHFTKIVDIILPDIRLSTQVIMMEYLSDFFDNMTEIYVKNGLFNAQLFHDDIPDIMLKFTDIVSE